MAARGLTNLNGITRILRIATMFGRPSNLLTFQPFKPHWRNFIKSKIKALVPIVRASSTQDLQTVVKTFHFVLDPGFSERKLRGRVYSPDKPQFRIILVLLLFQKFPGAGIGGEKESFQVAPGSWPGSGGFAQKWTNIFSCMSKGPQHKKSTTENVQKFLKTFGHDHWSCAERIGKIEKGSWWLCVPA